MITNLKNIEKLKDIFIKNKDVWVSKENLYLWSGINYSTQRSTISELRKLGFCIISKKIKGYKLTSDLEEIREFAINEIEKSNAIILNYQKWLNFADNKQSLEEVMKVINKRWERGFNG